MAIICRGNSYRAQFTISGRRFDKSFTSYDEANQWEEKVRYLHRVGSLTDLLAEQSGDPAPSLETLGELWSHTRATVWDHAKGGEASITNGREAVNFYGSRRKVGDITAQSLNNYVEWLRGKGDKPGTIKRKLAALSKMMSECPGLVKPKFPKVVDSTPKKRRYLTEQEEDALLDKIAADISYWVRHGNDDDYKDCLIDFEALTTFLLDTGLRLGEALALEGSDCNEQTTPPTVTVWNSKSGLPRTVPLTARALAAVRHFQGDNKPFGDMATKEGKLKRIYRVMWKEFNEAVAMDFRIHDLRHTCASRLVQRGASIMQVKEWMGHSDIKTTMIYAHLAPDNLADCVKLLGRGTETAD